MMERNRNPKRNLTGDAAIWRGVAVANRCKLNGQFIIIIDRNAIITTGGGGAAAAAITTTH